MCHGSGACPEPSGRTGISAGIPRQPYPLIQTVRFKPFNRMAKGGSSQMSLISAVMKKHPLASFFALAYVLSWWAWILYAVGISPLPPDGPLAGQTGLVHRRVAATGRSCTRGDGPQRSLRC